MNFQGLLHVTCKSFSTLASSVEVTNVHLQAGVSHRKHDSSDKAVRTVLHVKPGLALVHCVWKQPWRRPVCGKALHMGKWLMSGMRMLQFRKLLSSSYQISLMAVLSWRASARHLAPLAVIRFWISLEKESLLQWGNSYICAWFAASCLLHTWLVHGVCLRQKINTPFTEQGWLCARKWWFLISICMTGPFWHQTIPPYKHGQEAPSLFSLKCPGGFQVPELNCTIDHTAALWSQ